MKTDCIVCGGPLWGTRNAFHLCSEHWKQVEAADLEAEAIRDEMERRIKREEFRRKYPGIRFPEDEPARSKT